MRLAVISDIHGNLEAFREVLADMDRSRVDAAVCLGDNVGYGPEPEAVVQLIRESGIPCVMGNHELGVVGGLDLAWFNPSAQKSIVLTRRLLSEESLEYLRRLRPSMAFHGCLCVHGCPPASVTSYLFEASEARLRRLIAEVDERICFVGHTHLLEIVAFDGRVVTRSKLSRSIVELDGNRKYIINAGSVGQPRDGNSNAKYLIWDSGLKTVEVRFVPYDIAVTADKILELGFPEHYALRLW